MSSWFETKRLSPLVAGVAVGFFMSTTPASACSCRRGDDARQQIIFQEIMQEPGAVLAEVIVGDTDTTTSRRNPTTFEVQSYWAGTGDKTLTVVHNARAAGCGLDFQKGERILLLATLADGVLITGQCPQRIASYAKVWGKTRVRELATGGK
jgi:hypothetical protein